MIISESYRCEIRPVAELMPGIKANWQEIYIASYPRRNSVSDLESARWLKGGIHPDEFECRIVKTTVEVVE